MENHIQAQRRLKIWVYLLMLEVLAGINAGVVFRFFDRPTAGLVAGLVFCVVGVLAIWIARVSYCWPKQNLAIACIFTMGFSLPLIIVRLMTPMNQSVETVMGLPLEVFHRGSELSFMALVAATLIQVGFGWRHKKTRG